MRLYRRILLSLTTSLLRLVLIFGVTIIALLFVIGKPDRIESTLIATKTYDQFVPALIEAQKASGQQGAIPFTDPGVRDSINKAFPAYVIRSNTELFINNTYAWLAGSTSDLQFRIDITRNRDLMAENLTVHAFNRLAAQPICTTPPSSINPFTATCLPPNFSSEAERRAFRSEVDKLLPKTVFTAADLPKLSNGKTITENYSYAPKLYRLFVLSPYIFVALIVVLTAVLFWLCRLPRRALRLLGSLFFSSGIALIITPIIYIVIYPNISSSLTLEATNTGINALINTALDALSRSFYTYLVVGSVIVINVGLTILLAERITRPGPYYALSDKTGLASSERPPKRAQGSKGLRAGSLPIQTSEPTAKTRARRGYKAYRTLHDKEL